MTQAIIDTLKFTKELEAAGVERGHAQAIARGIDGALVRHLATKTDIAEVKTNVAEAKISITETNTNLAEVSNKVTKASLAEVRAEIKTETSRAETRLLWRMACSMAFLFVFIVFVFKL